VCYLPGRLINVVVPAEVTGIVISNGLINTPGKGQFALSQKIGDELGMVPDLEMATELRILVLNGIEPM